MSLLPSLPPHPVPRRLQGVAEARLRAYPVLTITGPRQSGKTTLARLLRPDFLYFSLEDPDIRAFATEDPRGLLSQAAEGAILDEVQRAPALLSYLQGMVDAERGVGRFILTGSIQLELMESVTQSLAGRTALLTLLPFSLGELEGAERAPDSLDLLLQQGLFPPIYDRPVPAEVWLQDYVATYVERDVYAILNVKDMAAFRGFVQLCAGRCGQLLNLASLAADAGVNRVTAQSWLGVLQASYLIFLVPPWSSNVSKRLIKSPKLYFCDSGLAAWLMGIRDPSQVMTHPQRGAWFENWAMTELLKAQYHAGWKPTLHFLRDKQGHEVDAMIETAPDTLHGIEMKSGATVASDFFTGLDYWETRITDRRITPWLIYGGLSRQRREQGQVLPWNDLEPLLHHLACTSGQQDHAPPTGG